jgi:hypothetical protein
MTEDRRKVCIAVTVHACCSDFVTHLTAPPLVLPEIIGPQAEVNLRLLVVDHAPNPDRTSSLSAKMLQPLRSIPESRHVVVVRPNGDDQLCRGPAAVCGTQI